jgi:D-ribose pyranose/furanose isomerase RbsD
LTKVTPELKYQVIKKYLQAYSMDEIAEELPLSKGAVHKIISDWRTSSKSPDIDDIRLFMGAVRKAGANISECIEGFRLLNILKKFRVYDELDEDIEDPTLKLQTQTKYRNIKAEESNQDNITEEEMIKDYKSKDGSSPSLLDLIRSTDTSPGTGLSNFFTKLIKDTNNYSSPKGSQISYFINTIYKNCKSHGISPAIIVEWIDDLFHFYSVISGRSTKDKTINNHDYDGQDLVDSVKKSIPKKGIQDIRMENELPLISRISFFIEQKRNEIHKLAIERNTITEEITNLNEQKEKVQTQLSEIIEKEKKVISYFQWYSNLRQDLHNRFNLIIETEFEAFANVINSFNEYGYNTSLLIREYKDFESLSYRITLMRNEIELKKQVIQDLLIEISNLEIQSYNYKQTMSKYEELRHIGFGLKELKQLNGLILEVSAANNIPPSEALSRFLTDLEKNYDDRLGLESKIKELQIEIEYLSNKVLEKQYHLILQDTAAPNLVTLYAKGLSNSDIIDITNLVLALENTYSLDYKSIRKDYDYSPPNIHVIKRNEFWKLVIRKFKDIVSINSEISKLEIYLKKLEDERNKI